MGAGASLETSPCLDLESWKQEAAVEPDDFSKLPDQDALKAEISRLRREIRKQVSIVLSKDDKFVLLDREIKSLLELAHTVEEWLTPVLEDIASSSEGIQLTGLQYKFKSFHSLKRKIQGSLKAKERQMARSRSHIKQEGGASVAASVQEVSDVLRYTFLIDAAQYTDTVVSLRQKLQGLKFIPYSLKNYWSEGDMYQGVNDVFTEQRTGIHVELQYHTPESWLLKSDAHVIYEKFRICSEPLEQQRLFAEGVALAAKLPIPPRVMQLQTVTKKSAPKLLDAYANQIVAACLSVKSLLVAWCLDACPLAKSVEAVVDDEDIIGLELSSLMNLIDVELTDAVQTYYDGFKVSIVCSPEDYFEVITSMCSKFNSGPQYLTNSKGEKIEIAIKQARNSYDKDQSSSEDVEGVRLHMVIGSQKTSSVYDNILFHVQFYTPDSLETEQKVLYLSRMLVMNAGISSVHEEIHKLWEECPDPPGTAHIQVLNDIPKISNMVGQHHT